MDEIGICKAALKQWGPDSQTLMVFEEMSELQKELCKAARGKQNKDAIAEEIADVYIMLTQMILLHKCAEEVEEQKARKLERLEARIAEAQETTGRDYDEQDKHCRECICPSCDIFKTADCLYGPDGCKKCEPDSHVGHCWWHPEERGEQE